MKQRPSASERAREFYVETYDASVPDWPGEIEFYLRLAEQASSNGQAVLELGCGTGRVAIRLAQAGAGVLGLDLSSAMLAIARQKSRGVANMRWVQADMRAFDLGETFGLVIIPGHAFQNILTVEDQLATLESIRRHLHPDGLLVVHLDHQDLSWLGRLGGDLRDVFEPVGSFVHPHTGLLVRAFQAWSYERATQTAISRIAWEVFAPDGSLSERLERDPARFHCVFRYEMAHLLGRCGFNFEALYGDFLGNELGETSSDMIWLAKRAA